LLSLDNSGTGHQWRLIDDQPWRRAYVVMKPGAKDSFVAKTAAESGVTGLIDRHETSALL